ncbi:MAG: hypothetical protein ACOCXA_01595 [Planctomycetota bacterium]
MHHEHEDQSALDGDDLSADDALEQEEEHERREWRSRIVSFLTSGSVHMLVLLVLAAILLGDYEEIEPVPVRSHIIALDPPPPPRDIDITEPEAVEIEVAVEELSEDEVDPSTLVFDNEDFPNPDDDAPVLSEIASPSSAVALGGGADQASGGGGFSRGAAIGAGSGVSFMGTTATRSDTVTGHLLFIIDMSKSLKEEQVALIKDRLGLSLGDLSKRDRFNVIFFSGPSWLPGDDPQAIRADWRQIGNAHDFAHVGDLPQVEWQRYSPLVRRRFAAYLADVRTTFGTDWRHPFRMAYAMDPQPQAIFFLTDGRVDHSEQTLELVRQHPHIPVHTIAFGLQDQDGVATLADMATSTGGTHVAHDWDAIGRMYSELLHQQQHQDVRQPR